MDKQEIFDTVAKGIIAQGGGSYTTMTPTGYVVCRYRNKYNGRRCAAGLCISDDNYTEHAEGTSISTAAKDYPKLLPGYEEEDLSFLEMLQREHDKAAALGGIPATDAEFLVRWTKNMLALAAYYRLNTEALLGELQ